MSQKHEAAELKRALEAKKFVVEEGKSLKHWVVRDPVSGAHITSFGKTPGGGRWKLNTIGDIRRWQRGHPEAAHLLPV